MEGSNQKPTLAHSLIDIVGRSILELFLKGALFAILAIIENA